MMALWIVLSLILSCSLGLFMAAPLFEVATAEGDGSQLDAANADARRVLSDRKERTLRSYKDLEFDYSMGKVHEQEFVRSKEEISRELAMLLEELRRYE